MNRIIPLGTIVRDLVTGFIGVAENRASFLYGCDRYCVQPRVDDDGKMRDSAMLDEPQLEIVDSEEPVMEPIVEPKQLVKMGQLAKDPITGVIGTITGRAVYLNGCSRVWITPKKHEINPFWIDEKQAEGINGFFGETKITKEPERIRRTGGPAPSSSKF